MFLTEGNGKKKGGSGRIRGEVAKPVLESKKHFKIYAPPPIARFPRIYEYKKTSPFLIAIVVKPRVLERIKIL